MPLSKVKKSIVYGSVLVGHYGADMSDISVSSTTWQDWGTELTYGLQEDGSFLEITVTGSAYVSANHPAGTSVGQIRLKINGQVEFLQLGIIGGNQSRSGEHTHQNTIYGENNGRQNWRYYGTGAAIYFTHMHKPGTINRQEIQTQVNTSASSNINFTSGYITITEIAGEHYNLT